MYSFGTKIYKGISRKIGSHCSGSLMPDYGIQEAVSSILSSSTRNFKGLALKGASPFCMQKPLPDCSPFGVPRAIAAQNDGKLKCMILMKNI